MKETDLMLLAHLRNNARETLTKISRNTSIPVSTIFDKLRQQEESIIMKHTSLVDFQQIGFGTRVKITLKVWKTDREKLRDFLVKHQNINSVYKINNGFDYLAEAIFRNIKDLEEFLEYLDEKFRIKTKQVYYIIEDLKREGFLADPQTIDIMDKPASSIQV
jgi:DNA-binding Lrp family transcriptional regulator